MVDHFVICQKEDPPIKMVNEMRKCLRERWTDAAAMVQTSRAFQDRRAIVEALESLQCVGLIPFYAFQFLLLPFYYHN